MNLSLTKLFIVNLLNYINCKTLESETSFESNPTCNLPTRKSVLFICFLFVYCKFCFLNFSSFLRVLLGKAIDSQLGQKAKFIMKLKGNILRVYLSCLINKI